MSSRPNPRNEPVGIERLIEMLNESEEFVQPSEHAPAMANPVEPNPVVTVDDEVTPAYVVTPVAELSESELIDELGHVAENRFAAHIVRGMSKSKTG